MVFRASFWASTCARTSAIFSSRSFIWDSTSDLLASCFAMIVFSPSSAAGFSATFISTVRMRFWMSPRVLCLIEISWLYPMMLCVKTVILFRILCCWFCFLTAPRIASCLASTCINGPPVRFPSVSADVISPDSIMVALRFTPCCVKVGSLITASANAFVHCLMEVLRNFKSRSSGLSGRSASHCLSAWTFHWAGWGRVTIPRMFSSGFFISNSWR
mmetsp:Transcript_7/g.15  ORF Transcript_7/g.15 Transcript_7/m.15 type:complete len:216 (+) Transcript_7:409-1056(+)